MVDFSGQCTRHSRARNEADWWGRTFLVAGSMKTNSRIRVERFLNSTFNAFICHVVWFWKSRENCRKLLRNIFGIKYKILLSIKLNIIIRFNSSNFLHFERIIRKSNELDSQNFPQKERKKEIYIRKFLRAQRAKDQSYSTFTKYLFSPNLSFILRAVVRPRHTALETRPWPITNLPRSSCYYSIKYQKAAKGVEGMVKGERE